MKRKYRNDDASAAEVDLFHKFEIYTTKALILRACLPARKEEHGFLTVVVDTFSRRYLLRSFLGFGEITTQTERERERKESLEIAEYTVQQLE